MIAEYIYEKASADYSRRVLLIDNDNIESRAHYSAYFSQMGFNIVCYKDDLHLRLEHEDAIYNEKEKYLLIVTEDCYVPYDVIRRYRRTEISLFSLFPKLNETVIKEHRNIDYDLLALAYKDVFEDLSSRQHTEMFIKTSVYGRGNIEKYLTVKNEEMHCLAQKAISYKDWCTVAERKAKIDSIAAPYDISIITDDINEQFMEFILEKYGGLRAKNDNSTPVIVCRAMEYMYYHSDEDSHKFAVIVMDGMSEFDWQLISQSFNDILFEKSGVFAMIPTITSVSRQCLLSNKIPMELLTPWVQDNEKKEFIECAKKLGFIKEQIGYERGYEADFGPFVKCAAVIINEIDDWVHKQNGRLGMYRAIGDISKQGKLAELVKRLLARGFDVFITADHGNTPCTGMGITRKLGVETKTKSRRMLVLKDFADVQSYKDQFSLIDFSKKYYLDKDYCYLLCDAGKSFDSRGEHVMSHGGITIDEVIVPFITIKAVDNNG